MSSRRASHDEVKTWQEDGWVLLEGLVGAEEIDAVAEDLREIFPSAEEIHADPEGVYEQWKGHPKESEEVFVWPDEGPGFRAAQQRWMAAFPFPGSGALNRLCVHPSIVDFAERALGSDDIRLYQAHASAKYAGVTNYEQPMHTDRNHSWLPAGSEAPWWNLEGFLYLTDVTEDDNPTRLVSVRDTSHVDNPYGVVMPEGIPRSTPPSDPLRVSGVPTSPTGRTVTTAAHPSGPAPGRASWWPSPSSTLRSNGSTTTRSRTDRRASSGPSSPRARRPASSSSSAGPAGAPGVDRPAARTDAAALSGARSRSVARSAENVARCAEECPDNPA